MGKLMGGEYAQDDVSGFHRQVPMEGKIFGVA
jgi:hypothetical protein